MKNPSNSLGHSVEFMDGYTGDALTETQARDLLRKTATRIENQITVDADSPACIYLHYPVHAEDPFHCQCNRCFNHPHTVLEAYDTGFVYDGMFVNLHYGCAVIEGYFYSKIEDDGIETFNLQPLDEFNHQFIFMAAVPMKDYTITEDGDIEPIKQ